MVLQIEEEALVEPPPVAEARPVHHHAAGDGRPHHAHDVLQLRHGSIRLEQRRRAQEVRHGADILDRVGRPLVEHRRHRQDRIGVAIEGRAQRLHAAGLRLDVVVDQQDPVVRRLPDGAIAGRARAEVGAQLDHPHMGEMLPHERDAAVGGPAVDQQHVVHGGAQAGHGAERLHQIRLPIVVHDADGDATSGHRYLS